MRRLILISIFGSLMLLVLAACGPSVVVSNKTTFPVRAVVASSGGSEAVSPSPGESSTVEVEEGSYRVTAIPDAEWSNYAKTVRKVLNDQLANADNLSGPQLLDVVQRLKDIAQRMQQFEQAAGSSASCRGSVSSASTGLVEISTGADGTLIVVCK